jgi:undecaprenyl-diphosphatase
LFLGLSRETAARFSFLLSLPAIFAAGVYEMYKERDALLASTADATNLLVATIVSGVVGYVAIAGLLRYLRSRTTYVFVVYRIALGLLLLALLAAGTLDPMR